jgi:hypothetical protein
MPEVYLFDFFNAVHKDVKAETVKTLNGYLKSCATKGVAPLRAWWWSWDPQPGDLDILIFISSKYDEIWKLKYPKKDLEDWTADGFTTWVPGDEVVSTVFRGPYGGEGYAMLIFHEIMHMKLRMGKEMHSLGGLASACVSPNCSPPVTGLSKDNIIRMRDAFVRSRVKQWPAGPALVFAKAQGGNRVVP